VEPPAGSETHCVYAYTFHAKRGSTWVCNFTHRRETSLCVESCILQFILQVKTCFFTHYFERFWLRIRKKCIELFLFKILSFFFIWNIFLSDEYFQRYKRKNEKNHIFGSFFKTASIWPTANYIVIFVISSQKYVRNVFLHSILGWGSTSAGFLVFLFCWLSSTCFCNFMCCAFNISN